jgi:hypothetical protein
MGNAQRWYASRILFQYLASARLLGIGVVLALTGVSATARAQPAGEFRNLAIGAVLGFGYGSSAVGDSLLGDLGAEVVGIRSFHGRAWLAQWDGAITARGGLLGNTIPYTWLAGLDTLATGEVGYRFMPSRRASLYSGAGLGGELSVLTRPGSALSQLKTLNDLDGVGGLGVRGRLRVDVGLSFLDEARSLLLFAPGSYTTGTSFTEGGVAVRFDTRRRLTLSLEVAAGRSPVESDVALATRAQTTRVELSALVRKLFRERVWLALGGAFSRDYDRRSYSGSAIVYRTASAPAFNVNLVLGISLDRQRRLYGP